MIAQEQILTSVNVPERNIRLGVHFCSRLVLVHELNMWDLSNSALCSRRLERKKNYSRAL